MDKFIFCKFVLGSCRGKSDQVCRAKLGCEVFFISFSKVQNDKVRTYAWRFKNQGERKQNQLIGVRAICYACRTRSALDFLNVRGFLIFFVLLAKNGLDADIYCRVSRTHTCVLGFVSDAASSVRLVRALQRSDDGRDCCFQIHKTIGFGVSRPSCGAQRFSRALEASRGSTGNLKVDEWRLLTKFRGEAERETHPSGAFLRSDQPDGRRCREFPDKHCTPRRHATFAVDNC